LQGRMTARSDAELCNDCGSTVNVMKNLSMRMPQGILGRIAVALGALAAALAAFFVVPSTSFACKCAPPPEPAEALAQSTAASILDVRTVPEYQQVGHIPGTPLVVWPRDGVQEDYQAFVDEVAERFEPGEPLLLLCRSGVRSHHAAHLLTQAGFTRAYNILEGFEGGQPGQGWRAAGLPWEQG